MNPDQQLFNLVMAKSVQEDTIAAQAARIEKLEVALRKIDELLHGNLPITRQAKSIAQAALEMTSPIAIDTPVFVKPRNLSMKQAQYLALKALISAEERRQREREAEAENQTKERNNPMTDKECPICGREMIDVNEGYYRLRYGPPAFECTQNHDSEDESECKDIADES